MNVSHNRGMSSLKDNSARNPSPAKGGQFRLQNGYTEIEWGGAALLGKIIWPDVCCACGCNREGNSQGWAFEKFTISSYDGQFTASAELLAHICPGCARANLSVKDCFRAKLRYKDRGHILILQIGNPRVADIWRQALMAPFKVASAILKENKGVDVSFDRIKPIFGIRSDKRCEPGTPEWKDPIRKWWQFWK